MSEQEVLFEPPRPAEQLVGYRAPAACRAAGITYRRLDHWARTGLVTPSLQEASGSGSLRLYSFEDILLLRLIKRLLDTGVSLNHVKGAVEHLRAQGVTDLASLTIVSDGTAIYECTSAQEVFDLMRGGQGVFGIAVDGVAQEVTARVHALPNAGTAAVRKDQAQDQAQDQAAGL